ncbi:hypothetical protein JCM10207_002897 [Rhodosporidiobolus poonsookiae]
MIRLELHAQLLLPSLLPLLHDCFHSQPPVYFAELEGIYQAIDNWDELHALVLLLLEQASEHLAFAQFGIYLPTPSSTANPAPPSYPFIRPRAIAACPTLQNTLRACGRSIGDYRGRFEDGEGELPAAPEQVTAKERQEVLAAGWDCLVAYESQVARMHAESKS